MNNDIDYDKLISLYHDIICELEDHCFTREEYLDNYTSFDKASYRLQDVRNLKQYYNQEDFYLYAIEHIDDARCRIWFALDNMKTDIPDWILNDMMEYDDLVESERDKYVDSLESHKAFKKYNGLLYLQTELEADRYMRLTHLRHLIKEFIPDHDNFDEIMSYIDVIQESYDKIIEKIGIDIISKWDQ